MKKAAFIFLVTILGASLLASEVSFEVIDEEGKTDIGKLISLDGEKVALENEKGTTIFPMEQVARLRNRGDNMYRREKMPDRRETGLPDDSIPPISEKEAQENPDDSGRVYPETVHVIELIDGTRLVAVEFRTKGKTATYRLLNEKEQSIPLDHLAAVRLAVKGVSEVAVPPNDWVRLAVPSDKGDRVVVAQHDALDVYEGILSEIGKEFVSFIIDGETLPVPRRKVYGLLFHAEKQAVSETSENIGVLTLYDGGRIRLEKLSLNSEGNLVWTNRLGLSGTVLHEEIESIDFSRKNTVYLASLKPLRIEQSLLFDDEMEKSGKPTPQNLLRNFRTNRMLAAVLNDNSKRNAEEMLLQAIGPRRGSREDKLPDRSIPGLEGVRLDGVSYGDGMMILARTVLEYTFSESFSKLRGTVGIDDRLRPAAAARLLIQADDQLIYEFSFRGDEPAQKIDLNLPGNLRLLRIIVDFPDGIAQSATLGLGDVKLIK